MKKNLLKFMIPLLVLSLFLLFACTISTDTESSKDEKTVIENLSDIDLDQCLTREKIYGTEDDDYIYGNWDENDYIWGYGGNDKLYGSGGDDYLDGGDGNDKLYGSDGNDILYGRDGNDRLEGGYGNNKLNGNDGNDTLIGGPDRDDIYGGKGNDKIYPKGGTNFIEFEVSEGTNNRVYITVGNSTNFITFNCNSTFEFTRVYIEPPDNLPSDDHNFVDIYAFSTPGVTLSHVYYDNYTNFYVKLNGVLMYTITIKGYTRYPTTHWVHVTLWD